MRASFAAVLAVAPAAGAIVYLQSDLHRQGKDAAREFYLHLTANFRTEDKERLIGAMPNVYLYAAKVQNRGLSAVAQCESLRYKLLNGLAVRRACYGVLRFIMESGAKGCEVVVSGKLRAARAKSMKFTVR